MKEMSDFALEELPWYEILDRLHRKYYENLKEHFADNPEMLELFSNTQLGLRYNAELIEEDAASARQEVNSVWDDLSVEVTRDLHAMLIEDYGVPVEDAQAVQVGYIGAIFLSPAAPAGSICPKWHYCGNSIWVMAFCPC